MSALLRIHRPAIFEDGFVYEANEVDGAGFTRDRIRGFRDSLTNGGGISLSMHVEKPLMMDGRWRARKIGRALSLALMDENERKVAIEGALDMAYLQGRESALADVLRGKAVR